MNPETIGIKDGHLQTCGPKPNCVSSQSPRGPHFIEAIKFQGPPENLIQYLLSLVDKIPNMKLEKHEGTYFHFTVRSPIFGFVDDIEFYLSAGGTDLEVRSASRVGYSDFKANRKRVEKIRNLISQWS